MIYDPDDVCVCGHTGDEHDPNFSSCPCEVDGCECIHFEIDEDATVEAMIE